MNTDIEGSARSADGAISMTVGLGGVLRELEIRDDALRRGGRELARVLLDLARQATAHAGQRARNRLRDELTGLPADALAALGFTEDEELVERVESTTPATWRVLQ